MSAHVKARYGHMTSGRERRTSLRMLALTVAVAMACLAGPLLMATPAHAQTECGGAFGYGTARITAQTSGNVASADTRSQATAAASSGSSRPPGSPS
jgi:hypothetical protein